jgi:hypothetical protein
MKIVTAQSAAIAGITSAPAKENVAARPVTGPGSDTVQFETGARYLEAAMKERPLEALAAYVDSDPSSNTVAQHLLDKGFDL